MKAALITTSGAQDQEIVVPLYYLPSEEISVEVATPLGKDYFCILGVPIIATMALDKVWPADFDLLVIPGGVKAMERLRKLDYVLDIVREFHAAGKVIASICSGAQLLISAGLAQGRVMTCYDAMRVDLENAGAEYRDAPVVVHDRIVTSPHYKDSGHWMKATVAEVRHVAQLKAFAANQAPLP